jgi:CubicO group peptidase (beta-lactamase class C family)
MHEDEGAILRLLSGEVEGGRLPGASWRVEDADGVVEEGAVGFACLTPRREPATLQTPYDLGSLTKPLATAPALLRLHRDRRLDLRAPAAEAIEELRGAVYGTASLLEIGAHRAGFPAWKPLYLTARTLDDMLLAIARSDPAGPIGTTLYSDLGYMVLGAAAMRASGTTLDRLFEDGVARPLSLPRIGFAGPGSRFSDAAATERGNGYERRMAGEAGTGFAWREEIPRGEVHDGNAHLLGGVAGHAGLFGTAAEVAAIGLAMLASAPLALGPEERDVLLRPVAGPGSRTFGFTLAALSWAARDALPPDAPGHTGFTGTSLWLDPERGAVYVLLTNRVHPHVDDRRDLQPLRREFHRLARLRCGRR